MKWTSGKLLFLLSTKVGRRLFLLLSISILSCGHAPAGRADDRVTILRVSSQTVDLVTFQISLPKHTFAQDEDVRIAYTVRNNSRKAVYLVVEERSRLSVDEKRDVLKLESPVKRQDEFTPYDYDLIRIAPGRSFSRDLVIKAATIPKDLGSESDDWNIQIGFSYVINPSRNETADLLECGVTRDSFPCLGKLFKLSKSLTLGNLMVEVKHY